MRICVAALLFDAEEYLFKFNLQSNYHDVDIHPDYHIYLGFQCNNRGDLLLCVYSASLWFLLTMLLVP